MRERKKRGGRQGHWGNASEGAASLCAASHQGRLRGMSGVMIAVMAVVVMAATMPARSQAGCASQPSQTLSREGYALQLQAHSCHNASTETAACFLRCACDGADVDHHAVKFDCVPKPTTSNVPGFAYWNVSVEDANVTYSFSMQGAGTPSHAEGTTSQFASDGMIPTPQRPSSLRLEASYDPHNGANVQTNMYWTPCAAARAVSATRRLSEGVAHITASWKKPDTTPALLEHIHYTVRTRNTTRGPFHTVASDVPGRIPMANWKVPMGCAAWEIDVTSRFVHSNGTTLATCLASYPRSKITPARVPDAPGQAVVDTVHLTRHTGTFTWEATASDGGCSAVEYHVMVMEEESPVVMGQAVSRGMHNTTATVLFDPPLTARKHYIVEVAAFTPVGSSKGTQSVFIAPGRPHATSMTTRQIVGGVAGSVVALGIVLAVFLLKCRNRDRTQYTAI